MKASVLWLSNRTDVIRRALCEYFIKALMLSPKGLGDLEIKQLLDSMSLDYPSVSYLMGLREQLKPPEPFRPKDTRHKPSVRFLGKEGVIAYFENGPDMLKAKEILEKPRAKEFTESMLISKAPFVAIAYRLGDLYKTRYVSVRALELYKHFYFNVDLLDSTETRAALYLKVDRLVESEDPEIAAQGRALKKASYTDPRRTAANLPQSPVSATIAQLQMGLMPGNLNLKGLIESTEALTNLRANEAVAVGGLDFDRKLLNLTTAMRTLQELKESKLRPEDELRKELATLTIKTNETTLPLANEVTGGNHTVDLVAMPKAKQPDERPSKK